MTRIGALLEAARTQLPFGGRLELEPVKEHVFRLTSGTDRYLVKWIDGTAGSGHDEVAANRTWLSHDDIAAPRMVAAIDVDDGVVACWEWLDGDDLRAKDRDRLPEAFAALGRFHDRRRHDGPVVSPLSLEAFGTVGELVAAEIDRLVPLVDASLRSRCAQRLRRLAQGYATVIHGDAHPGNIILAPRGLHFVDWSLARPSVNVFDLDYLDSVPLEPPMPVGAYMPLPEATAILHAYAAGCGMPAVDIAGVHVAVMLWRDLSFLESFIQRPRRDERAEAAFRGRVSQLLARERTEP